MASANNYKLLIEGQLDPKKINAQITKLRQTTKIVFDVDFKQDSLKKLSAEIARIKSEGGKIGKIKLFEDDAGGINKTVIEYTNKLGQIEKITRTINADVIVTKERYIDVNKVLKEQEKLREKAIKLSARQSDEMAKAELAANKVLEKAKTMGSTSSVRALTSKAQEVKVAVSSGDIAKVRELSREMEVLRDGVSGVKAGLASWATGLQTALKRTIEYSLSVGLLYGALSKLKEGVKFITDLNTEMTKIQVLQIDGAKTNDQIADLAVQYNGLAKELGSTTIEITKGSVEWLRQGKTIEETAELLRSTMYLSKLGNLESAESTEYLTSILNGFQMETEDAVDVVNKLVAIDNIAATSAGELATGLQYSSAVANEAGVSFENLAAMIGTVSSNTRLSAEMIGTAFRTMFVRMQQVKAGGIDETGMSLNNVEKTLSTLNISLRDSKDEFRDMEDVIADVAAVWEDLGSVQRAQISNAIAGQRQAQIFSSLMQNWADVTTYLGAETDATGLAQKNYAIYLQSVEVAMNRLTTSWEALWQATIESGAISWFYDLGATVIDLVTNMGGLIPIVKTLVVVWALWNSAMIVQNATLALNSVLLFKSQIVSLVTWIPKAITATKGMTVATAGFNAVAASSALIVAALLLAMQAIIEVQKVYSIQTKAMEENTANWETSIDKVSEKSKSAVEVADAYVASIVRINKAYEDQEAIVKPFVNIQEVLKNGFIATATEITNSAKSFDEYSEAMQKLIDATGYEVDEFGRLYKVVRNGLGIHKEYVDGVKVVTAQEYYLQQALSKTTEVQKENTEATGFADQAYKSLAETMKDMTDVQSSLQGIMDSAEAGDLGFDQLDELAQLYPEYLDALTIEGDKLRLNTDMVREYMVAKAEAAVQQAQANGVAKEEIALLEAYASSLRESQTAMVGGMELTRQLANEVFRSIADEVYLSGESFVDLQGKALNSADAIYNFLSSGDSAFNSFVQQAANITGLSTQAVAQAINNMLQVTHGNVAQTINSIIAMGQQAGATMGQIGSLLAANFAGGGGSSLSLASPMGLFKPSSGGGGGGGGGSSGKTKAQKKAEAKAEKLKKIQDAINKAQKDAISNLDDQLDKYGDIIDARKKMLDSLKKERDYNRSIEEQNSNILSIQNELATLQFDNSAEAEARRRQLEDDLRQAQLDLEDTQFDHSIDAQKEALDADYAAFETAIQDAINQVQGITASSVGGFSSQLAEILANISPATVPQFHDGGMVGGSGGGLQSNELFAKLLRGETVVTEGQANNFMKNILPEIAGGSSMGSGDITIDMPIHVAGNLDKSVMPDLEMLANGVIKKINDAMLSRGHNRRADLFQT